MTEAIHSNQDGVATVAFSGSTSGGIILSLDLEPDEQDRRLGLAGLHLEVGDQLHGGYDLVARVAARDSSLEIDLRPDNPFGRAKVNLSLPEAIETKKALAALQDMCAKAGVPFDWTAKG